MAYIINESTALLDRAVLNKIRIDGFEDSEKLQSKGIVVVNPKSKVNYICPSSFLTINYIFRDYLKNEI